MTGKNPVTRERFDAVLFDLDGVITSTANVHAECWKRMFDEYLERRAREKGESFHPFDIASDYTRHVDGKPRFDGVRDFLRSRGIELPEGSPDDPVSKDTVCGLGNRKNELVNAVIESAGVEAYAGTVSFIHALQAEGIEIAVVTSSQNCDTVVRAAHLSGVFPVQVDGNAIQEHGLRGKPAPDMFLLAAKRLGVVPARAVVVEDALSGVEAGRNGAFGLVIGVARKGNADELRRHGAHLVVNDLSELLS